MKYGYFTNYRKAKTKDPFHYYSDLARGLLIVASIAMLLSVSPFNDSLPQSFAISILAAVIFALLLELFSTNQNFVTITNLFWISILTQNKVFIRPLMYPRIPVRYIYNKSIKRCLGLTKINFSVI